jgi:hypothetical protein
MEESMSHELSKKHQGQIAEKAAIIANTAFKLGRQSERNRILEIISDESINRSKTATADDVIDRIINLINQENPNETN